MSYTKEQLELKEFLEKGNEQKRKELEAEGCTFYTLPVEDIDYWISMGINNIEQYEHNDAAATHSDLFKELYGSRPRWPYDEMTTEDILESVDHMCKEMRERNKTPEEIKKDQENVIQELKKSGKETGNYAFADLGNMMGK